MDESETRVEDGMTEIRTPVGKSYDVEDLQPAAAIAGELGLSRSAIVMWARRYPDFPAAVIERPNVRLWSLGEVRAWYESA